MKTIKTTASAGKAYGHVPGNSYHDVDVTIVRSHSGRWSVELLETWGISQGHGEEHGRKTVTAAARTLEGAVAEAFNRAEAAELQKSYTTQALSCAENDAAQVEDDITDRASFHAIDLSVVTTDRLVAELDSRGVSIAK